MTEGPFDLGAAVSAVQRDLTIPKLPEFTFRVGTEIPTVRANMGGFEITAPNANSAVVTRAGISGAQFEGTVTDAVAYIDSRVDAEKLYEVVQRDELALALHGDLMGWYAGRMG